MKPTRRISASTPCGIDPDTKPAPDDRPVGFTGTIDQAMLRALLVKVEAQSSPVDWYNEPTHWLLYDLRDAKTMRILDRFASGASARGVVSYQDYEAQRVSPAGVYLEGDPEELLSRIAQTIAYFRPERGRLKEEIAIYGLPGMLGVAFVCEGWQAAADISEADREAWQAGKSLADIVGSLQSRRVCAADRAGGRHLLNRTRGLQLDVHDASEWGGISAATLELFVAAMNNDVPPLAEYRRRIGVVDDD